MKRLRYATLALLAASLLACSRQDKPAAPAKSAQVAAPAPAAASPRALALGKEEAKALMRLIFPGEPEQQDDAGFRIVHAGGADEYHLMTLASARDFPDGRRVLVVNGGPCTAEGEYESEHGAGSVSVYVLRRQAGKWEVAARHEHLAYVGSFGSPGDVQWLALGPGKDGFVVSAQTWDANMHSTSGTATVFALTANGVRQLGSIPDFQDDRNGCHADSGVCTDAKGVLRVMGSGKGAAYPDLQLHFIGMRYTATGAEPEGRVIRVRAKIRQTARYRFDGTQYVLAAGSNPIGND